ncbi:hypothetical protein A4H97_34050 [Niastella yeongjuensis]|uniref:Uncharacterized protein n=1 Tax=Niastella yeongjuensis TaxID=354355 RepID=A0A1V9EBI3_9BACT|nr:hypothetical protein [Niastella yeongjuensis]OQP43334.1 hypothetical protein A4H97_34050 [Niastella yeongjuensis]SEP47776.1 hypothetical protein SAMN05660816_06633 [Niastella yeongjuensis]
MEKEYQVTYKTYYNDRLKQTNFHGKLMYPLYVQVTFDRKSIFFKSFFFDLFSKPKYAAGIGGQVFGPDVKDIIKKEESLIEFIIDKNRDNFSLDLFKTEYAYYGRDLLDMMEAAFLEYLYTFLHDEGLPYLAETVNLGSLTCKLYDLVLDFKRCMTPQFYQKLWDNSFYYSPPYLVLCAFNEKPQQTLLKAFTVMDWEGPGAKEIFADFLKKSYPNNNVAETLKAIEKYVLKEVN